MTMHDRVLHLAGVIYKRLIEDHDPAELASLVLYEPCMFGSIVLDMINNDNDLHDGVDALYATLNRPYYVVLGIVCEAVSRLALSRRRMGL